MLYLEKVSEKLAVSQVGGKGAALQVLMNLGVEIPPTWIIEPRHYLLHISELPIPRKISKIAEVEAIHRQIITQDLSDDLQQSVTEVSKQIGISLTNHIFAVVRSSANYEDGSFHSFAGIFDSFVDLSNVLDITNAIKMCWASIWTQRAFAYCQRIGLQLNELQMAVLLQQAISPTVAGVAYTCDPRNMNNMVFIVESTKSHGEELVSGRVTPTLHQLSAKNGSILTSAGDNYLAEEDLHWIWKTLTTIGDYMEQPQEIEWCINGDDRYVLQTRAVTTHKSKTDERNA